MVPCIKAGDTTDPYSQTEERNTGHISGDVYKAYLDAGKAKIMLPLLLLSVILIQGSTVMSSYW